MTVAQLEEQISARELVEWQVYHQLEPFGEERADLRAASVAWTVAVAAGAKNVKLEDFLLRFEPKQTQTTQDMLLVAEMWNEALGGRDLRESRSA